MSTHTSGRISKPLVERLRQVLTPAREHNVVVATLQHLSRQTARDLLDAFEASSLTKSTACDVWRFALDRGGSPKCTVEENGADAHREPAAQTKHLLGRPKADHDDDAKDDDAKDDDAPPPMVSGCKVNESLVVERTASAQVCASVRSDVVHIEVRTRVTESAAPSVVSDLDGCHVMVQLSCSTPVAMNALGTECFVVRRQFARTHTYTNRRGYEYILSVGTCETHELDQRCIRDNDGVSSKHASRGTDAAAPWSLDGMEAALLDTRKQERELSVRYCHKADVGTSTTTNAADAADAAEAADGRSGSMLHHSVNALNLLMQCLRQDMQATLAQENHAHVTRGVTPPTASDQAVHY